VTTTRRGPWLGGLLTLAAGLAVLSIVSLTRSLVTMAYLNVKFAQEVNPFKRAVSYYMFVENGRNLPVMPVSGLIQRILFGLEVGMLLILTTRLLRVSTK
jgi:hypothetical protein